MPSSGSKSLPRLACRCVVVIAVSVAYATAGGVLSLVSLTGGTGRAKDTTRRWVRRLLVRLGPSFVKGAQLLSTRRDVLPVSWCDALAKLYDQVPPLRPAVARRLLLAAYPGGEIRPDAVRWDAVASGSIACVYRASLPDGTEVALKIRRPRVQSRCHDDFALMAAGARVLQILPPFRRLPAAMIVRQLGAAVGRQADFGLELAALHSLRDNFADLEYLRVPQPVTGLCRPDVLVMEYIADLRRMDAADDRQRQAERVLHCVYRMLFLDGLVHCDMHPGNLYLRDGGQLVLLDAGFVVRLDERVRSLFAEFFLYMVRGDGGRCADIVRRSAAAVPADADLESFQAGMIELISSSTRRRAADFSLVRFATRLFDLQRRHGLFAAPEFIFPLLALLVLEGRINDLDAQVDFQAAAMPVLLKALRSGYVHG